MYMTVERCKNSLTSPYAHPLFRRSSHNCTPGAVNYGGHGSWDKAGKHVITWAFILEETCREYRSWLDKLQAEAVLAQRKKDIVCEDRDKQKKLT